MNNLLLSSQRSTTVVHCLGVLASLSSLHSCMAMFLRFHYSRLQMPGTCPTARYLRHLTQVHMEDPCSPEHPPEQSWCLQVFHQWHPLMAGLRKRPRLRRAGDWGQLRPSLVWSLWDRPAPSNMAVGEKHPYPQTNQGRWTS